MPSTCPAAETGTSRRRRTGPLAAGRRRKTGPVAGCLAAVSLLGIAGCGDAHTPKSAGGVVVAAGPANAQTVTVHGNDRDQFSPQTVQVRVGTVTITLQNGGVPHNLTFRDGGLPGIGTVSGSDIKSTTLRFAHPGTYVFECTIHPGMTGSVVVTS